MGRYALIIILALIVGYYMFNNKEQKPAVLNIAPAAQEQGQAISVEDESLMPLRIIDDPKPKEILENTHKIKVNEIKAEDDPDPVYEPKSNIEVLSM